MQSDVMPTINEPARELPVPATFDVVIAGGGIAGVAAAIAASRGGATVCLLEKSFSLGGLATTGNVIVWLPICDGVGHQVIAGLPEELLRLAVRGLKRDDRRARLRRIPPCWQSDGDIEERTRTRFSVEFNPTAYQLALEQIVSQAGITIMYDTRACDVARRDDTISHVLIENKDGRSAIAGRYIVDATGDADLCFLSEEETESLDSNVATSWIYTIDSNGLRHTQVSSRREAGTPTFRGDDAEQVTAQLLASRELVRQRMAQFREARPDDDVQLVNIPTAPCMRMTRRLVGDYSLTEDDAHKWFDDTIGFTGDWRNPGPVYAVPWRTLHARRNRNLLVAGRCISSAPSAWEVTRSIPCCAMTGTATGIAVALALREQIDDLRCLPVDALQADLKSAQMLLTRRLLRESSANNS